MTPSPFIWMTAVIGAMSVGFGTGFYFHDHFPFGLFMAGFGSAMVVSAVAVLSAPKR